MKKLTSENIGKMICKVLNSIDFCAIDIAIYIACDCLENWKANGYKSAEDMFKNIYLK